MEKFDFNYQISDWQQRKELVDKYITDNKILEQIEELTIENTVPDLFDKKTGEPIRYHQLRDSRLTELNRLVIRLYDYILYAYDKQLVKPKQETKEQKQALINDKQGIKSFIDKRKRGKHKEPNWAIIDENIIQHNKDKLNRFDMNTGIIIYKQIIAYQDLKYEVASMNRRELDKKKLIRLNLITDLCQDIKICEECCDSVNRVYITEDIRSNHDRLSDVDIVYDNKTIKTVLSNWYDIVSEAQKNPSHYIHTIYMDFTIASKKVKLTSRQKEVLYMMINHENTREYTRDIKCICEKFKKILKS